MSSPRRRAERAARVPWAHALVVAVITTAPGIASAAPELIGAERCGACHEAEYQDWLASGHASALARLTRVQQRDPTCRSCHTTAPTEESPALAGVQCESCHGAGSLYSPRFVMKDRELAKLLGLTAVTEEQCAPCHAKDSPSVKPFDFAEKIQLVSHKRRAQAAKPATGTAPTTPPTKASPTTAETPEERARVASANETGR